MVTSRTTNPKRARQASESAALERAALPVTEAELRVPRHADKWPHFFWNQRGTSPEAVMAGVDRVRDAMRLLKEHPDLNMSGKALPTSTELNASLAERKATLDAATTHRMALHVGVGVRPDARVDRAVRRFFEGNDKPWRVDPATAWLVVDHLVRERVLPIKGARSSGFKSECSLAAALIAFFDSNSATRDLLPVQFQGSYFTYRRSVHWPGAFVKGSLVIKPVEIPDHMLDPNTKEKAYALVTTELHLHDGGDGSAPAREVYIGVLSRKATYPFILSSLSGPDREPRGAPRFTLFHTTVFQQAHKGTVASLTGTAVTSHGQRQSFAADVCVERFCDNPDKPPAEKELGLFLADDRDESKENKALRIPPSVIARLSAGGG